MYMVFLHDGLHEGYCIFIRKYHVYLGAKSNSLRKKVTCKVKRAVDCPYETTALSDPVKDMLLHAFFSFGALAVVIFPSEILCSHYGDIKVLIGGVGTCKVGEITTFNAVVVTKPDARTSLNASERVNFEFSWKVSSKPWVILKHERTRRRWDNFQWRWTEAGDRTVFVYVRIFDGNGNSLGRKQRHLTGYSSYFTTNETKVTVRESDGEVHVKVSLAFYQTLLRKSVP